MAVSSSKEACGLTLDGLSSHEASAAVIRWLQEKQLGAAQTNYKLRDWLFARQRYWGEPFPIVFEEGSEVSAVLSKFSSNPLCLSIAWETRHSSEGSRRFTILNQDAQQVPEAVPESALPLTLPETDNFKPSGSPESPLANVSDWVTFTDHDTGADPLSPHSTKSVGIVLRCYDQSIVLNNKQSIEGNTCPVLTHFRMH